MEAEEILRKLVIISARRYEDSDDFYEDLEDVTKDARGFLGLPVDRLTEEEIEVSNKWWDEKYLGGVE